MSRRAGRELALKVLYQWDLVKADAEVALRRTAETAAESGGASEDTAGFAAELVRGVLAHQAAIDARISELAHDWSLARMAAVDRNILRIAAYELLFAPGVPASASINEAVELAKRYGTGESGRFVNGILGNLLRGRPGTQPLDQDVLPGS